MVLQLLMDKMGVQGLELMTLVFHQVLEQLIKVLMVVHHLVKVVQLVEVVEVVLLLLVKMQQV